MAFPNPYNSPISHYLTNEYRIKVAEIVNNAILLLEKGTFMNGLERVVKQTIVVRDVLYQESLKEKTKVFPQWSLDSFLQ